MRTRRFANSERIRAKERRLQEVLRRQQAALSLGAFPSGVLGSLSYTAPIGSTTVTVQAPLRAVAPTAPENWVVDFDPVPDPTGGFAPVNIPAGKQIAELATDATLSFAGLSQGSYTVVAQQALVDEHPETRNPPGKYAGGTGVFAEHEAFFGHGKADGTPIPREGYDDTLAPETISEAVDRLNIIIRSGPLDDRDVPLLQVQWSGATISAVTNLSRPVDFSALLSHIGQGGNAHALATTGTHGFMAAADKQKLDAATSSAAAGALVQRDGSGRFRAASPSHDQDVATKAYVDNASSVVGAHNHDNRYVRFDEAMSISGADKERARNNIFAAYEFHNHNDIYYTKTQVDNALGSKLDTAGTAADSAKLGGEAASSFVRTNANSTVASGRTTTFNGTLAVTGTLRIPVK